MRYLLLMAAAVLVGCGGAAEDEWTKKRQKTYPVTGLVTFKGGPLEGATVVFTSQGEKQVTAVGRTDVAGKFRLTTYVDGDGAVAGKHDVLITAIKTEGPPPGANLDEVDPTIKETSLIPRKYGQPGQSGLTATVTEAGPNEHVFELTE